MGKGTTLNIYLYVLKKTARTAFVYQISGIETGNESILLIEDEAPVVKSDIGFIYWV